MFIPFVGCNLVLHDCIVVQGLPINKLYLNIEFVENIIISFISNAVLFNFMWKMLYYYICCHKCSLFVFNKIIYFHLLHWGFLKIYTRFIVFLYTQLKTNRKPIHEVSTYFLSFDLQQKREPIIPTQRKMNINSFMSLRKWLCKCIGRMVEKIIKWIIQGGAIISRVECWRYESRLL